MDSNGVVSRVLVDPPRVLGLSLSRALGDKKFKEPPSDGMAEAMLRMGQPLPKGPLIISTPDITHLTLGQLDGRQYLVLACDGLYDVFSNEECMEWLVQQLGQTRDVQALADKLCDDAVNVRDSRDNVSIVLIQLDEPEAPESKKRPTMKPSSGEKRLMKRRDPLAALRKQSELRARQAMLNARHVE